MTISFFLGGARSGKSTMAENLATEIETKFNKEVIYIATAAQTLTDDEIDLEMQARISHHQQSRPKHWQLVGEPIQLANVLEQHSSNTSCLLIDCLTLWLTNCLLEIERLQASEPEQDHTHIWQEQKQRFLEALKRASEQGQHIIIVSNEVGHGIVPMGELSRRFVDESGWLHQDVAKIADSVDFVMAGLSLPLKEAALKDAALKNTQNKQTTSNKAAN